MKQTWAVFRFEYGNYLKSKGFRAATIIFCVIVALLTSVPAFIRLFDSFGGGETAAPADTPAADMATAVFFDPGELYTPELLFTVYGDYRWERVNSLDGAEEKVAQGDYALAVGFEGLRVTVYEPGSKSMFSDSEARLSGLVRAVWQQHEMEAAGLTQEQAAAVVAAAPVFDVRAVGKDAGQAYWPSSIILILLYICIMLYGQFVLTSVVTEKSSKAMELLLTSARPSSLMLGKVVGVGLAGMTQFGLLILTLLAGLQLNMSGWRELSPQVEQILRSSLGSGVLLYALLFFVLGFFSFAFVYAGIGSTVSRMEDAGSLNMIPTMLFVLTYMVAMGGMAVADSTWVTVCGFVPLMSPLLLFMRICMTDVPPWQVALGVGLNLVYIWGAWRLCAKIYRTGVMIYGNKPKLKDLWRYLRQS